MEKVSIDSIETFGLVDGPGIRTVVFFNGCKLRCKYCHNPEMWQEKELNYTSEELFNILMRFKPYFRKKGGVTFSGGEPLLQDKFLLEICKELEDEGINIALDTSGVGNGNYEEILKYVDLVIFDVKAIDELKYKELTGIDISESLKFLELCQSMDKKMWLRHVIVPGVNDTEADIIQFRDFISNLKNIKKVELVPYHLLGVEKYKKLGIPYVLEGTLAMEKEKMNELSLILNKKAED